MTRMGTGGEVSAGAEGEAVTAVRAAAARSVPSPRVPLLICPPGAGGRWRCACEIFHDHRARSTTRWAEDGWYLGSIRLDRRNLRGEGGGAGWNRGERI